MICKQYVGIAWRWRLCVWRGNVHMLLELWSVMLLDQMAMLTDTVASGYQKMQDDTITRHTMISTQPCFPPSKCKRQRRSFIELFILLLNSLAYLTRPVLANINIGPGKQHLQQHEYQVIDDDT